MDDERVFKKYQWIDAYVTKALNDPRPESYKIRYDDIQIIETIPTRRGDWSARAEWILQPDNIFASVEAIREQQSKDRTSLGLIKPGTIADINAERFSQRGRDRFWQTYQEAVSQMELPLDPDSGREIKPLTPPDYRFKIQFRCNDTRCLRDHSFSVLDWELDALYFNLRQRGDSADVAAEKVVNKLRNEVCGPDKDLYFFLGNLASHPLVFTIVGLWWPKKRKERNQLNLF